MKKKFLIGIASATLGLGLAALVGTVNRQIEASAASNGDVLYLYVPGEVVDYYGEKSNATFDVPCAHIYNSSTTATQGSWPGVPMTAIGHHLYSVTITGDYDRVIFTNYSNPGTQRNTYEKATDLDISDLSTNNLFTLKKFNCPSGLDSGEWGSFTASFEMKRWAEDFLNDTNTICNDNGAGDHAAALSSLWKDGASGTESGIYLKGDFNSWGDANEMKRVGDSDVYRSSDVLITTGQGFKIHVSDGDKWYPDSNHIVNSAKGHYKVEFNSSSHEYSVNLFRYFKDSYADLSNNAKALFVSSSADATIAEAYNRYAHIVTRYQFEDFAEKGILPASKTFNSNNRGNNETAYLIATIAGVSLLGGAAFVLAKRRKQN